MIQPKKRRTNQAACLLHSSLKKIKDPNNRDTLKVVKLERETLGFLEI
jgi:hypothetical protein